MFNWLLLEAGLGYLIEKYTLEKHFNDIDSEKLNFTTYF